MFASQRGELKMGDLIDDDSCSRRDSTKLIDTVDALLKIGPYEISIRHVNEGTPFHFMTSNTFLLAAMASNKPAVKNYLFEKAAASGHY